MPVQELQSLVTLAQQQLQELQAVSQLRLESYAAMRASQQAEPERLTLHSQVCSAWQRNAACCPSCWPVQDLRQSLRDVLQFGKIHASSLLLRDAPNAGAGCLPAWAPLGNARAGH